MRQDQASAHLLAGLGACVTYLRPDQGVANEILKRALTHLPASGARSGILRI